MKHSIYVVVSAVSFSEDGIPEKVRFWGAPEREEFHAGAGPRGSLLPGAFLLRGPTEGKLWGE